MTEPTPELLAVCREWLAAGDTAEIRALAAFVQAREQATREQWEEEIMGLRERIAKLVSENDRLEDHIALLSHTEPKGATGMTILEDILGIAGALVILFLWCLVLLPVGEKRGWWL